MVKQGVAEPALEVQWTTVCFKQSVWGEEELVRVRAGAVPPSPVVTRLHRLVISH